MNENVHALLVFKVSAELKLRSTRHVMLYCTQIRIFIFNCQKNNSTLSFSVHVPCTGKQTTPFCLYRYHNNRMRAHIRGAVCSRRKVEVPRLTYIFRPLRMHPFIKSGWKLCTIPAFITQKVYNIIWNKLDTVI